MRRVETYVGQQVYEWLFSSQAQLTMIGLAKLSSAILGAGPIARGLACAPTTPASMTVQIGKGELYEQEDLEATVCGTLPADTTDQILKQGIQLGTYTTAALAAPTTSGQSINYLLECQYQDSDISLDPTTGNSPATLQFYDVDNPSQPWDGPNNSGDTSNTFRDGIVAWQIKAGVAANTGSQVTPTPDAGWTGLWVVTVPYGATSLTSTNISQYPGSPLLPADILPSMISGILQYGTDSGTVNAVQASFPLPSATIADNQPFWVKIKNANTGATTFTPNPGVVPASPVVGAAHQALQGNELAANGRALFIWRQDISSYVLIECTGGALQIPPATAPNHAVQMAQAAGVVGSTRNLAMSVTAASANATLTADEIIVENALGGVRYCLASFNKTINLAKTGAGGMDTGTAPTSGFVALYAIYNPTTGASALLARNATSAVQPNVYGGANMPAGYTASALVSVWPTNASGQFVVGYQSDRSIATLAVAVLTTSTPVSTQTPLAISGVVPLNARLINGYVIASSTATSNLAVNLYPNANQIGGAQETQFGGSAANTSQATSFTQLQVVTPGAIGYTFSSTAGTPTLQINVNSYTF